MSTVRRTPVVKPSLYLNCVPWAVLALLRALCKFPPATPRATRQETGFAALRLGGGGVVRRSRFGVGDEGIGDDGAETVVHHASSHEIDVLRRGGGRFAPPAPRR